MMVAGVSSQSDIHVGVLNRQLVVHVPRRYLLALDVPALASLDNVGDREDANSCVAEATEQPQQQDGGPAEPGPALAVAKVVFRRASGKLRVVMGEVSEQGHAIAYGTLSEGTLPAAHAPGQGVLHMHGMGNEGAESLATALVGLELKGDSRIPSAHQIDAKVAIQSGVSPHATSGKKAKAKGKRN